MRFQSTKLFDGYSACFRQWKADGTHCKYLHSYVISFKVEFNHGVEDIFNIYPELKKYMKDWFKETFDHVTFVAEDDPHLDSFKQMEKDGTIKLHILPYVGCERFSEYVFNQLNEIIKSFDVEMDVESVETFEHEKNSALFIK